MAYETGTSTGANDLLDKIRIFAVAQGWTQNRWVTVGSGRELCISKGTAYFNFRSYQNESVLVNGATQANKYGIVMNGSTGYSGGANWDRQPGYPVRSSSTGGDQGHVFLPMVTNFGPFPSYHFFTPDSKCLHVELEITTGVYQRMGFGSLDLFNPASPGGGHYIYSTTGQHVTNAIGSSTWLGSEIDNGSFAQEEVPFRQADHSTLADRGGSMVRAAFDSFDGWCGSGRSIIGTNLTQACQGGGVHDKILRDSSPNPMNGIGVLTPNVVSVLRSSDYLHPLGTVPGLRYMNMTNYLPGDEFNIGSDTWKVFPWYQKGGRSYQRGIVHKKVT